MKFDVSLTGGAAIYEEVHATFFLQISYEITSWPMGREYKN